MGESLMILGRQPALGLAELESLYGASQVRPAGSQAAIVAIDPCLLAYERLGGSLKFCKILATLDTTSWREVEQFLARVAPDQAAKIPPGKMHLGLSVYDFNLSPKKIEASGLELKKIIHRATNRTVRLVPSRASQLNTAQVLHNKLLSDNGWELVFVKNGTKTIVAQTVKVQDIASYAQRDRERPRRDARVGMLPPKLAQIIINLAAGKLAEDKLESICEIPAGQPIPRPQLGHTMLDPFCGTGVILQEALLAGYAAIGTDLETRMIEYSQANLGWLKQKFPFDSDYKLSEADATSYKWPGSVDFVASETYLGRAFTSRPTSEILSKTASECNLILKKFLQNIAPQLVASTRLCLAVPAWQTNRGEFRHLPLVDQLGELGYNRVVLEHAREEDLIYFRENQIVARQLLIITRK